MKRLRIIALSLATCALAQAPADTVPAAATLKQLMLDLVHPASNEILLAIFRGGPKDDAEWAGIRRSALTLAEMGPVLTARGPSRDSGEWQKDSKLLVDAGAAAYKAAQARDGGELAAVADRLDRSCTTCHKQFRPNVFPREGGSR